MTKMQWNQVGERRFEAGVDRGVLYLSDGSGVPWNGLTSVDQKPGEVTVTPYYNDGVKYYNERKVGDFSAVLKAFTYPDEFLQFDGFQMPATGLFLDSQPVKSMFGLSYRTKIGNDVRGLDFGYKIHLLYNLTATPSDSSFTTMDDSVDPEEFSWTVVGIPELAPGYRPTVHAMLDTRYLTPTTITTVEGILYGSSNTDARIPSLAELMTMITTLNPTTLSIIDNGDGSWTATGSDAVLQNVDASTYQVNSSGAVMTDDTSFTLTDS